MFYNLPEDNPVCSLLTILLKARIIEALWNLGSNSYHLFSPAVFTLPIFILRAAELRSVLFDSNLYAGEAQRPSVLTACNWPPLSEFKSCCCSWKLLPDQDTPTCLFLEYLSRLQTVFFTGNCLGTKPYLWVRNEPQKCTPPWRREAPVLVSGLYTRLVTPWLNLFRASGRTSGSKLLQRASDSQTATASAG